MLLLRPITFWLLHERELLSLYSMFATPEQLLICVHAYPAPATTLGSVFCGCRISVGQCELDVILESEIWLTCGICPTVVRLASVLVED